MEQIVKIAGALVGLALVAVLVVNGSNTANIIAKLFGGFTGAITAASKG